MGLHRKYHYRLLILIIGVISVIILQSAWLYDAYKMKYRHIMAEIEDAFELAYQKEQTYRIPVVDIVNPGGVTIQSCGNEEITIVRKCYDADTIVYNNMSGHSIVEFLNRVFWDIRENMVPMNIYCLADLFGGMLHDKNIAVSFVIDRYNVETGEVIESSLFQDEPRPEIKPETTLVSEISNTEAVRAILHITPGVIFAAMPGILIFTILITLVILICLGLLYKKYSRKKDGYLQNNNQQEKIPDNTFSLGKFSFDPDKNELRGFGETVQLNKKENAILYALCMQHGNIVERHILLEENWGSSGIIYSRSLDTYLTNLRKYLKKDPSIQIVTVKGVGYKLVINGN